MARKETRLAYAAKGMLYAAQGQKAHPDVIPLEALCRHAEGRADILKPSTVRLYRRQYATAALKLCRDAGLSQSDLRDALQRMLNALDALKGEPPEPRTSSKKVKDPRDWVVKEVVGQLKLTAVRYRRIRSAACALYCLLVPKLGTRPVELTKAWVEDDTLFVPSAKQPEGQEAIRSIDISDFHPTHREALLALIYIVDRDVEAGGYDAWLKRLAETLARACETVSRKTDQVIPRLSPSSFRHTAISTWHAAGYTAEEIAELVGHRNLRSQNAYKRASSAWPITTDLAKPADRGNNPTSNDRRPDGDTDDPGRVLDLDDMPQPQDLPPSDTGTGIELWIKARQKLTSQLDQIHSKPGGEANTSQPSGSPNKPKSN